MSALDSVKSLPHETSRVPGARIGPRGLKSVAGAYILSAIAASILNIAAQEAVRRLGPPEAITVPMLAGTIVGFAAKYMLDKHVVFLDAYRGPASELRKVAVYGLFGVLTTLIFWAFELAFWWLWSTTEARYLGAVLGLAVGYVTKFVLDRAFVFQDRHT